MCITSKLQPRPPDLLGLIAAVLALQQARFSATLADYLFYRSSSLIFKLGDGLRQM